ncbi:MAG: 50S ribosomal protein L9 [Hyphomicrobiales bacterium]|nr:50S ribosomal protein L9 [Hyphomicrobiales bacterium]
MEIILLERVARLGKLGDIVRVKDGYARNYLLPQKKALRTTKDNLALFARERDQREAANRDKKQEAEAEAAKLKEPTLVLLRQAGDTGQLYGSVNSRDVMAALAEHGIMVTRQQIVLNTAIKTLGLHEVRVMLHPEVPLDLSLNVARTEAEAKRQAAGEDMTVRASTKQRVPRTDTEADTETGTDGEDGAESEANDATDGKDVEVKTEAGKAAAPEKTGKKKSAAKSDTDKADTKSDKKSDATPASD